MPDTMYDSTQPQLIPRGALYIAVYGNGIFATDAAEIAKSYPNARIYVIDVNGTDAGASIKDVETGDLTVDALPDAVNARFDAHPDSLCRVYCNLSTWPNAKIAVAELAPERKAQVRWWIANPTFPPVAHFVPGSNATQYAFGDKYDSSLIGDAFK